MTVKMRSVRKAKGITIMKLHYMTGIARSHLSDIETETKTPSIKVAYKIANALGVSVYEIFVDE